jgi:hypothetical protein
MQKISIAAILIILFWVFSCSKPSQPYPQQEFASDLNFRLGKWYSISDTVGDFKLGVNSLLDTIWFINDALAGWTGFVPYQPRAYVFWKTYVDPKSIYNLIYLAPDNLNPSLTDTVSHQFSVNGDTLTILWDSGPPVQIEQYLKMK